VEGDRLFRVEGGYDRVVGALMKKLAGAEVRFGAEVHRVAWRRGRVRVEMKGVLQALPPVQARAAIITLPVGVLQAGTVTFAPRLPADKRSAISTLKMGGVIRVLLRFRRLPGPMLRRGIDFLHVRGGAVPTFWSIAPLARSVLVGWAAGPAAAALPEGETARLGAALDSLARGLLVPRAELQAALDGWRVFDWKADRWARGAYTFCPPGAFDVPARLAAPIEQTLFFAGEATHVEGASGTVHGAIETGQRAAAELLASLRG
jgi:monoamine oxidase